MASATLARDSSIVNRMILVSGLFSRIWRVAWIPFIPGIRTSMNTMSGLVSETTWMASSPDAASPTTSISSARLNAVRSPSRVTGWSSTMRTRISPSAPFATRPLGYPLKEAHGAERAGSSRRDRGARWTARRPRNVVGQRRPPRTPGPGDGRAPEGQRPGAGDQYRRPRAGVRRPTRGRHRPHRLHAHHDGLPDRAADRGADPADARAGRRGRPGRGGDDALAAMDARQDVRGGQGRPRILLKADGSRRGGTSMSEYANPGARAEGASGPPGRGPYQPAPGSVRGRARAGRVSRGEARARSPAPGAGPGPGTHPGSGQHHVVEGGKGGWDLPVRRGTPGGVPGPRSEPEGDLVLQDRGAVQPHLV